MIKKEVKEKCIELRVNGRKSLDDIHKETGVSVGFLSNLLKSIPLREDEVFERMSRSGGSSRGRSKYCCQESSLHKIAASNNLDGNQKGRLAEVAVLLRLCANGFEVYGSPFDGERSDWVAARKNGRLWRIQVRKTHRCKWGMPVISLRTCHGSKRYLDGEIDFVVGYDMYADVAYVFSWEEVRTLSCGITATPESAENWQKIK